MKTDGVKKEKKKEKEQKKKMKKKKNHFGNRCVLKRLRSTVDKFTSLSVSLAMRNQRHRNYAPTSENSELSVDHFINTGVGQ